MNKKKKYTRQDLFGEIDFKKVFEKMHDAIKKLNESVEIIDKNGKKQ